MGLGTSGLHRGMLPPLERVHPVAGGGCHGLPREQLGCADGTGARRDFRQSELRRMRVVLLSMSLLCGSNTRAMVYHLQVARVQALVHSGGGVDVSSTGGQVRFVSLQCWSRGIDEQLQTHKSLQRRLHASIPCATAQHTGGARFPSEATQPTRSVPSAMQNNM